ncbi:MAG: DinB family protein [Bacteroidia bacterium]
MTELLKNLIIETDNITAFLNSIDDEKANTRRLAGDWSVMECMEHIFISEKAIYKLLNSPELFTDAPSTKHEKIEEYKTGKFEAPVHTLPKGRFSTLAEIKEAFITLRVQMENYIIHELPKAGHETYPHPILGPITKIQWFEFVIEHNQRHLLQMEKVLSN